MTTFDPNTLTKDRLKAELKRKKIDLPKEARKEVYVELYRKHLSPRPKFDFSSDEEISFTIDSSPGRKRKSNITKKSNVSIKKESKKMSSVESLTDSELAAQLRSYGVDVGPILVSTRRVYQRKLEKLLSGQVQAEPVSPEEEEEEEDDYSDEDQTEVQYTYQQDTKSQRVQKDSRSVSDLRQRPLSAQYKPSPQKVSSMSSSYRQTTRYRQVEAEESAEEEEEEEEDDVREDDVDGVEEVTKHNYRTAPRIASNDVVTQAKTQKEAPAKRGLSVWLQLGILLLVALIIFLVIHNLEPASNKNIGKISKV